MSWASFLLLGKTPGTRRLRAPEEQSHAERDDGEGRASVNHLARPSIPARPYDVSRVDGATSRAAPSSRVHHDELRLCKSRVAVSGCAEQMTERRYEPPRPKRPTTRITKYSA